MVDKGFGIACGEIELGVEHTVVLKEQARAVVGVDLDGEIVDVKDARAVKLRVVHKEVVELYLRVAFV